jgi:preprotein translocase subunit YajC
MIFNLMLMAPPSGDGADGGMLPTLIMFGAIFLIMYFLMIRPQQKKQKEQQKMLSELRIGDKVVTSSGMYGSVVSTDDETVLLKVSDNTNIRFLKSAVTQKK